MNRQYKDKLEKTKHHGIYQLRLGKKRIFFTKSLDGKTFFNEKIKNGYREFDIRRSKLAAAIAKGISDIFIEKNSLVLYLGASHGYTSSFISDIVGINGAVYCVEFAPRVIRDLVEICDQRENMAPILADANQPDYEVGKVDIIYQDIAQKNQVEILFKNLKYLKKGGYCLIAIKSRSIDVTKNPSEIFGEVKNKLKSRLKIIDFKVLDPFERDHCFFVCQMT